MSEFKSSGAKLAAGFCFILGMATALYGLFRFMSGADEAPALPIVGVMTAMIGIILWVRASAPADNP